jgi:hypothetical protein
MTVTCLPRLEPHSFPPLFALTIELVGEILQRWQQSTEHTHQPPIDPMSVGFFMATCYAN